MSKLILIVGQKGAGKSHSVKNVILPKVKNAIVYDVYNYEYPDLEETEPEEYKSGKMKYVGEDEERMLDSLTNYRNTCFIMEDATVFLDNSKRSKPFKRVIYGMRHKNVMIVLLFHALNRVPKWLYEQSNVLILLKTGDFVEDVRTKFKDPRIYNAFLKLKQSKNPHEKVILNTF
jgi:hypothetical protein